MKPKIIIVEGCDCSGKTTFINDLIQNYRFKNSVIIKNNFIPKDKNESNNMIQKYANLIKLASSVPYQYVIFDRFIYSELAYGYLRGYEPLENEDIWDFIQSTKYHKILFLNPPINTIKLRLENRGDKYITNRDIEGLISRYIYIFDRIREFRSVIEIKDNFNVLKYEDILRFV